MKFYFTKHSKILFCSDIHLRSGKSFSKQQTFFAQFLINQSAKVEAIFILGDLFDTWMGDACIQRFTCFFNTLLSRESATPIYVMPGNRDFLLRPEVLASYGLTLIPDPCQIIVESHITTLTHGDLFCTHDWGYQILRILLQNPLTFWLAHRIPYAWKRHIADFLRTLSISRTGKKKPSTMSANPKALQQWAYRYNSVYIIFGHVHRQSEHSLVSGKAFALDCWDKSPHWLILSQQTIHSCAMTPPSLCYKSNKAHTI